MTSPIVLLTDFGASDPFVGIMKGVILGRNPAASIVDLTHLIPPQDVRLAAFTLMGSAAYFQDGALFVCVVDPGVGSSRRILWARSDRHQFLAPDNGLLSWVDRVEPMRELRAVTNRRLFLERVSATFHGRDIFAPVAAELSRGVSAGALGPVRHSLRRIPLPRVARRLGAFRGVVLALDRFGNAVTNMRPADLPPGLRLRFKGRELGPVRSHYAAVEPGEPVAVVGSFGFIELSVRNGDFARICRAAIGDSIEGRPR